MALHLIKLCVGAEGVDDLIAYQKQRLELEGEIYHLTRMFPKRKDDLLKGGSLYWIFKGNVLARQAITAIIETKATDRKLDENGETYCKIVLDPEIVLTQRKPHRPFQGWRYLKSSEAPNDKFGLGNKDHDEKLAEIGVI